jgi:integrase
MLSRDMERYVELKRAAGFKFNEQNNVLKSFVAFATASGDEFVRIDRVLGWAALASSPQRRRTLMLTVRRFALTLQAEDSRHEVPSADSLGRAKVERRAPYIYTADEICRLMQAAARMQPQGSITPVMYATLFGLLAATGLRISEALALQYEDVTEDGLIIRQTKLKKSRLVPLHDTTRKALDTYLSVRKRHGSFDGSLFVSTSGRALAYDTVLVNFRRLARSIGLRGEPGPRIHDLRHTFAVRSLERCGHDRDVVARHIVALSTYLGHVRVTDTYWYLEATPIVMRQIAEAGETSYRRGAP